MHNLHRRILIALPFLAFALIPSSAYAITYTTYTLNNENDVIHSPPGGQVETVYGYNFFAYVTIPTQITPSTPYTVTISKSLNSYQNWLCQNTNTGNTGGP